MDVCRIHLPIITHVAKAVASLTLRMLEILARSVTHEWWSSGVQKQYSPHVSVYIG